MRSCVQVKWLHWHVTLLAIVHKYSDFCEKVWRGKLRGGDQRSQEPRRTGGGKFLSSHKICSKNLCCELASMMWPGHIWVPEPVSIISAALHHYMWCSLMCSGHVWVPVSIISAALHHYPARALRALGLLLADGTPTGGRGEDFLSRQPNFFTETAVTPERKVEKTFPRWEINRHVEG